MSAADKDELSVAASHEAASILAFPDLTEITSLSQFLEVVEEIPLFPHPTADDEVVKPPNLSDEKEEGGEREEEEEES